jgi:hypothetical protein
LHLPASGNVGGGRCRDRCGRAATKAARDDGDEGGKPQSTIFIRVNSTLVIVVVVVVVDPDDQRPRA